MFCGGTITVGLVRGKCTSTGTYAQPFGVHTGPLV